MLTVPNQSPEVNTVVVGAGPIGLLTAIALKTLHPDRNIVILEKYESYQRKHVLIVQAELLESFIRVVGIKNPKLQTLVTQLQQEPHIRTSELQTMLEDIAKELGIVKKIKTVTNKRDIEISYPNVKWIIGADGTKSVISNLYFGRENQEKTAFDYTLQIRLETPGSAKSSTVQMIDLMLNTGILANEYVGGYDSAKGCASVTTQCIISKESYDQLRTATSKTPYYPWRDNRKIHPGMQVPKEINRFLQIYMKNRLEMEAKSGKSFSLKDVRISVNESPVTKARKRFIATDKATAVLVGDAQLGLSYFKGLNGGIESLTKFMELSQRAKDSYLQEYDAWFEGFSQKKIKEVTDYSKYKIRLPLGIIQNIHQIIEASGSGVTGELAELVNAVQIFASRYNMNTLGIHSHRMIPPQHDQFDSPDSPIRSVLQIKKLLVDAIKPYKTLWHFTKDLWLPYRAIKDLTIGAIKLTVGFLLKGIIYNILSGTIFKKPTQSYQEIVHWLLDGLARFTQGLFELFCVLLLPCRLLIRSIVTLAHGEIKIENNVKFKQYISLASNILAKDNLSTEDLLYSYTICLDIHRKYRKGLDKKGQTTSIKSDIEQKHLDDILYTTGQDSLKESMKNYLAYCKR